MDSGATGGILRDIHTLYGRGTMGGHTDAELLERFLARGDSDAEDAFATLVARHGPTVLRVCRRMLPASHDAEDAFQATFLVLARRAASIVRRERVASWLYSVAVRTAQVARRRVARQRAVERRLMDDAFEVNAEPAKDQEDWLPILDDELNRLPHRYRIALVACELEGRPRREAARQLGIPEGTLSTHLARGRKLLRDRLRRRGVNLELGPVAGLAGRLGESAVPERLIGPTVRSALLDSSAAGATGCASTAVSSLAERVLKMMFLARLTLVAAVLTMAAAGIVTSVALGFSLLPKAPETQKAGAARGDPAREAAVGKDRYGDPLPAGAVARLGSNRFRRGDRPVNGMRFSHDGQNLLTVSEDFLMCIWETKTGRLLHEVLPGFRSFSSPVGVAISPDGKHIALSGSKPTTGNPPGYDPVRLVVDATSGKEVGRLSVTDHDVDLGLAFTPDGKSLMSLQGTGLFRIDEIASGAEILRREFPRDSTGSMTISPDGKLVAIWTGANTKKLYVWDWQGDAEPRGLKLPRDRVDRPVFSPDGKALFACDDLEPFVYEWDVTTGDLKHQIELRDNIYPNGVAITPDGKTIAVTDYGNRRGKNFSGGVLLLERKTGKLLRELPTPGTPASHVVFSPDGRWLAASGAIGVHVWDWQTGAEIAVGSAGHQGEINEIATAPGGLIATASDDHTVRIWDAATGIERRRLPHGGWVRAVAVSPDCRFLASSSLDDFVRLWSLPDGTEVFKLPGHGRYGGHRTVGFAQDGQRFLSYGDDFYLRIWDVKTGKVLIENPVQLPGVAAPGNTDPGGLAKRMMGPAAFAADGQRLVAVIGGSTHIIETETGRISHNVNHGEGRILSLAIAPDGRTLATTGWGKPIRRKLPDGQVQSTTPDHHPVCLAELATGKLIRELELPTSSAGPVAFSADGKLLAVGFGLGVGEVRLLDAATQETLAVLANFGSTPHAMAFTPDGKYLITGLNDGTAPIWDLARVLTRRVQMEER
jgi:RNA polymerase sigma factor (sigma-70 family)